MRNSREPFDLDPADRPLLEAAARLQDVGYLINYDQHHKHSYHLILNSRLAGFQPQELELIANVARYHRGAEPKTQARQLPAALQGRSTTGPPDWRPFCELAGGLDRSNTQQVQSVTLGVQTPGRSSDQRKQVALQVMSLELPEVDLWGAKRRAEFFEQAFDAPLAIYWQPSGPLNGQSLPDEAEAWLAK